MLKAGDLVEIAKDTSQFIPEGVVGVILEVRPYGCHEMFFGYTIYLNHTEYTALGYQLKFVKEQPKEKPAVNETAEIRLMRRYFG
jgi:hypothetical protein